MNLKNEPDRYRGGRACSLHVFFTGAVLFFGASTSAPAELRYWGIRFKPLIIRWNIIPPCVISVGNFCSLFYLWWITAGMKHRALQSATVSMLCPL